MALKWCNQTRSTHAHHKKWKFPPGLFLAMHVHITVVKMHPQVGMVKNGWSALLDCDVKHIYLIFDIRTMHWLRFHQHKTKWHRIINEKLYIYKAFLPFCIIIIIRDFGEHQKKMAHLENHARTKKNTDREKYENQGIFFIFYFCNAFYSGGHFNGFWCGYVCVCE